MPCFRTQLRAFKPRIRNLNLRIFPGGDTIPTSKDGVFPEKVNEEEKKLVLTQGE